MAKNEQVEQVLDVVTNIIKNSTGWGTDLARNLASLIVSANPAVTGLVLKAGSSVASAIKSGALTKFIADFAVAKQGGLSAKAALEAAAAKTNIGVSTRGFAQAGSVGKVGTVGKGIVSILGIIAAMQVAKATIDTAKSLWKTKAEAVKREPNLKTAWELFWETSIPVSTYRWIEGVVKTGKLIPKEQEKVKQSRSSNVSKPVQTSPQTNSTDKGAIVEKRRKEIEEYERSKKLPAAPKTTADRFSEFMKKKNSNSNHPEWYTKFPEFVTTNLNFGVRKEAQYFPVAIGSRILFVQTIPQRDKKVSQAYIDQLNVLFAKLRGSNSGAFNYTTSDVMAYVECTRGIRIVMHQIAKLIKSINNVDLYLAKTPDAFMGVLGLNAAGIADLKQNRALYVARYNQMAELIKANFPIAPDMTVYDRDKYISTVILEDGKGPKSSIFTYITEQVICASATPGQIEQKTIDPTSVYEMFRNLDTLVNQAHLYVSATYSNYDTFAKIAGDMFKAYGDRCLYAFELLDLNSKNQVQYDEYLLHQLQNAQIITYGSGSSLTAATAAPENITYSTQIYIPGNSGYSIPIDKLPCNNAAGCDPVVINTNKSNITGAEALSLTRGIWYFEATSPITYNTNTTVEVDTCDTIVFKTMYIDYFDNSNTIQTIKIASTGNSVAATSALYQSLWSQIDYAPAMFRYDDSGNTGAHVLVEDIDTYAYMTIEQYQAFNDTAVLSMYKTVDLSDQVNFRARKRF